MTAVCASVFPMEQFMVAGGRVDQPSTSAAVAVVSEQPKTTRPNHSDRHTNLNNARHLNNILSHEQVEFVYALVEPRVIADDRLLMNLLNAEEHLMPSKYCEHMQTECTPLMRYKVVEWMQDVCREERVECEVLPLAVNLLDRFLSREVIFATQLQLLATTCLFVAAKVKLATPLPGEKLCKQTDDYMTIHDLMSWELLVLKTLNWDVCTPVVFDFIEHLLSRFPLTVDVANLIRAECQSLVPAVCRDYRLCALPMSMQACMCVYASAAKVQVAGLAADILTYIHQCLRYDPDLLQAMADDTLLVPSHQSQQPQTHQPPQAQPVKSVLSPQQPGNNQSQVCESMWLVPGQQHLRTPPHNEPHMHNHAHRHGTVVTPTDVQDVFAMLN